MGVVSEQHPTLRSLLLRLEEVRSLIKKNRWKTAKENLQQIVDAVENFWSNGTHCYGLKNKKLEGRSLEESDVWCCGSVLIECGLLWNSLLSMNNAISCFKLAESVTSSRHCDSYCSQTHLPRAARAGVRKRGLLGILIGKTDTTSQCSSSHGDISLDVVRFRIQTHLYLFDTSTANELLNLFFYRTKDRLLVSQSFPPRTRDAQSVAKALLLDVAYSLTRDGRTVEAVSRLTTPTCVSWASNRAGDFSARRMEAERYSLLAYARYLNSAPHKDDVPVRSPGDLFSDAYHLWEKLHWPLDCSECIVNTLARYAIERIQNGHYGAENPVLNTFLDLNARLWTHCGDVSFSVGRHMYDVSQAAEKVEKHSKSAHFGERTVAVFRACSEQLPERTMFIGATLYLIGLNYFKENQLQLATKNIQQCIPLLERSVPKENSPHYLFAMRTLAQAYGDLAHVLKIQSGAIEQSLFFSEKALQHKQFLTHSVTKTAQAIRADSLHCKGALVEHEGNVEEAEQIYQEANEMFIETITECTNSFEFIAYGYFLYRRNDFSQAARMLKKGYELATVGFPALMFTHDEWHTLTEELKFEVQNASKSSFDVPNRVVALYFHVMLLIKTGVGFEVVIELVRELAALVDTYDYISCGDKSKLPASKYRCSSLSLLGYVYRKLEMYADAAKAFRKAHRCYASKAANINMQRDTKRAEELGVKEYCDTDSVDDIDL